MQTCRLSLLGRGHRTCKGPGDLRGHRRLRWSGRGGGGVGEDGGAQQGSGGGGLVRARRPTISCYNGSLFFLISASLIGKKVF